MYLCIRRAVHPVRRDRCAGRNAAVHPRRLALKFLDQLLSARHDAVRDALKIVDELDHAFSAQVVERLHHGRLRIGVPCANVHSAAEIQMLQLREVIFLDHAPRYRLDLHLTVVLPH